MVRRAIARPTSIVAAVTVLVVCLSMMVGGSRTLLADDDAPMSVPDRLVGAEGVALAAYPSWVNPVPAFETVPSETPAKGGYEALLVDQQYDLRAVGKSARYQASEFRLHDTYAVENLSTIEIGIRPAFEQLVLHELLIQRGERIIDALPLARWQLPGEQHDASDPVEQILEEARDDGDRTRVRQAMPALLPQALKIDIDALEPGDTVRVAWSIIGENPFHAGLRELQIQTEHWRPLARQHVRVLTDRDRPLSRRVRGRPIPVVVNTHDSLVEMIIDQHDVPSWALEADVPGWHHDRGTVVLGDLADWQSVVEWTLPMFTLPEQTDEDVSLLASAIRHARDDVPGQVGAALRWVQEEIVTLERAFHQRAGVPSGPAETLARRAGDSAEKSLLLMALLRELGVEAQAALVNTQRALESDSYPHRLHAFDKVVVQVIHDGQTHFLDTTLQQQAGDLGQLHEPDHGRALVLAPGVASLRSMGESRVPSRLSIQNSLVPDRDDATLTVLRRHQGAPAQALRQQLAQQGDRAVSRGFQASLQGQFPDALPIRDALFSEAPENVMQVQTDYRLPHFWHRDASDLRSHTLQAWGILEKLSIPANPDAREQPFAIAPEPAVEEQWLVDLTLPLNTDIANAHIENPWFTFSRAVTISKDDDRLSIDFRFRYRANEVAAEDLPTYLGDIEAARKLASVVLSEKPSLGAAVKEVADELLSRVRGGD